MCGRLVVTLPDLSVLVLPFRITHLHTPDWRPRYNLAPTQLAPVVTNEAERRLDLFRFGIVQDWAKRPRGTRQLINARVETVASLRSFRRALALRRCIIPVSGYYEWQQLGDRKRPLFIHAADGAAIPLAGVWEQWRSQTGEVSEGFVILTRPAVGPLQAVHDRMPLPVPSEHTDRWLNPAEQNADELAAILHSSPTGDAFRMYEVSPAVNGPSHDEPDCLTPFEPPPKPAQRQLELFLGPVTTAAVGPPSRSRKR